MQYFFIHKASWKEWGTNKRIYTFALQLTLVVANFYNN